jgi:UDP-N-acetylmuramate: L-alanyl-gamma-D-glutamyl-meso-diaminopimelate ligase
LSVQDLVGKINRIGGAGRALTIADSAAIAEHVARHSRPGDVLLVMSNGGFDAVHEKILQALAG